MMISMSDSEVDENLIRMKSFKGRPKCELCTNPYYGDNKSRTYSHVLLHVLPSALTALRCGFGFGFGSVVFSYHGLWRFNNLFHSQCAENFTAHSLLCICCFPTCNSSLVHQLTVSLSLWNTLRTIILSTFTTNWLILLSSMQIFPYSKGKQIARLRSVIFIMIIMVKFISTLSINILSTSSTSSQNPLTSRRILNLTLNYFN